MDYNFIVHVIGSYKSIKLGLELLYHDKYFKKQGV